MDAPLDLIQDVLPGTVALAVRVRKGHRSIAILGEERMGSGAVVDSRGYILTVNYLVLGAERITVGLTHGRTVQARVAARDHACPLGGQEQNRFPLFSEARRDYPAGPGAGAERRPRSSRRIRAVAPQTTSSPAW